MAGTVKSVNNPTASVQATGDLQGSIVDITVSGFDGGARSESTVLLVSHDGTERGSGPTRRSIRDPGDRSHDWRHPADRPRSGRQQYDTDPALGHAPASASTRGSAAVQARGHDVAAEFNWGAASTEGRPIIGPLLRALALGGH